MISKNFYLLHSPGSFGTYINWILSVSEQDLSTNVPKNPTNLTSINETSADITSTFVKNTPDLGFRQLLIWLLNNKPSSKKIYSILTYTGTNNFHSMAPIVQNISQFDSSSVFINLYSQNDGNKLVALNSFYKNPGLYEIFNFIDDVVTSLDNQMFNLNPYSISDDDTIMDLNKRNHFIEKWQKLIPLNTAELKLDMPGYTKTACTLSNDFEYIEQWKTWRSSINSTGFNVNEFLTPNVTSFVQDRVINVNVEDIFQANFIDTLESAVLSKNAGNFDFTYAKSYHQQFITGVEHLQYITDIENFRSTGAVSDYLKSTNLLQAFLIDEIKTTLLPYLDYENKSLNEILSLL